MVQDDKGLLELEKFTTDKIEKIELRDWWDLDLDKNVIVIITFKSGERRDLDFSSMEWISDNIERNGYYKENNDAYILKEISVNEIKKVLNSFKL